MRFVVLGSTGMLGSELLRVSRLSGLELLATSRMNEPRFDFATQTFLDFAQRAQLSEEDFVVNAIGWIPQKASGDASADCDTAYRLNAELLAEISEAQKLIGFRWLQIGTDCVFSGTTGSYSESSNKNATDLYGASKIAGEAHCNDSILIRSSIIGPDSLTTAGLYSWFKSQAGSSNVIGFQNHFWNGVTTTAFAKLAVGLAQSDIRAMLHHWIPEDSISKAQLLSLFAKNLGYPEGLVKFGETARSVDRTLCTNYVQRNLELWELAGYDGVPTIAELVSEMVDVDLGRR